MDKKQKTNTHTGKVIPLFFCTSRPAQVPRPMTAHIWKASPMYFTYEGDLSGEAFFFPSAIVGMYIGDVR